MENDNALIEHPQITTSSGPRGDKDEKCIEIVMCLASELRY